jgi:hypothetical protein
MAMKLAAVLMLGLLQAQTATFSGALADADCKADDARAVCRVLPNSKAFGIQTTDGKYMKLDSKGNAQVDIALRRLRRKTRDLDRSGVIKASISGARDGDTIKVGAVELY